MNKLLLYAVVSLIAMLSGLSASFAGEGKFRKPGEGDKCAVCGMFVAKNPGFAAQIQFRDGTVAHFDGPKDLFTFYLDLPRYGKGKKVADISAVLVTGYYTLSPIDGQTAYYVAGSDVNGPMGRELIPFAREAEAKGFKKDHKGRAILRFKDVSQNVIRGLQ